ncbi:MAG: hypothetical protein IPN29_16745 [Saprospiraceae bacterium]|nr:hypothetical protein [Saprospiraceae bacterium]
MLIQPATVSVIQRLRDFRAESHIPIYFTLDAGPNVHILYPDEVALKAKVFINEVLRPLANGGLLIEDHVGQGPKKN